MRAAVLSEVNAPLHVEDLLEPTPRIGEVLVEITTCGVCHSDHVMIGEINFPLPAVLGHEFRSRLSNSAFRALATGSILGRVVIDIAESNA